MKRILVAVSLAVAAVSTAGCTQWYAGPGAVAGASVLDERVALDVELTYKAARMAMETAVDAGLLKGEDARKASELNRKAYAAVLAVRAAYRAGNSQTYAEALALARTELAALVAALSNK